MKWVVLLLVTCVAVAQQIPVDANGYVSTPAGKLSSKCVFRVPPNTHVQHDEITGDTMIHPGDGSPSYLLPRCNVAKKLRTLKQQKRQFPSTYDGWLGYTTYHLPTSVGKSFDAFTGYFSVPNSPARAPEVLFIFTGLQNVDWIPKVDPEPPVFDIIQPVLQYPSDVVDENGERRASWSVRSWYVTLHDSAVYSDEISATPGSKVFGNMTRISGNKWFVNSVNAEGDNIAITVSHERLKFQPWAYTTIECYGCQSCSYLPTNGCQFSDMVLNVGGHNVQADWVTHLTPDPKCHTKAYVNSSSATYFSFQQ